MKLTFLGTGAGEGVPGFKCCCDICNNARKIRGKELRQNSAMLVEGSNGSSALIDMPPAIKMALNTYGINERKISTILLSHFHVDHTGGISGLLDMLDKNGHTSDGNCKVFMPEDIKKTLYEGMFSDQIDLNVMYDEKFYTLNTIKNLEKVFCPCNELSFTALETNHLMNHNGIPYKRESFGYLFSENGKNVAYLVDSSSLLPESTIEALDNVGKPLDCLIHECTYDVYPGTKKGHSTLESIIETKKRFNPKKMILTHISHRNKSYEELSAIMKKYDIDVAWDGMGLDI